MNEERLNAFLGKAVGDLGSAISAVLISIGDSLGYYRALASGPMTSALLAEKTGTHERYAREWLGNQAAGGYVEYEPATQRYFLNDEQRACLADPNGPIDLPGAYEIVRDLFHVRDQALENFRTGKGMEWGEHHACLFHGTERFFRAGYNMNLIGSWLPAFGGLVERLKAGVRAADIGCGHGASTILMAKSFPNSEFIGIDYHAPSIDTARRRAAEAGVNNAHFEVADATSYAGKDFDFIAFFDCLHDMGDPEGAARHVLETLDPSGTWMIVEPFANDKLEDNLNPIGRVFYSASTMLCTPASLSQEVGLGLGAQAGEGRLAKVLHSAGFTRVRRATETPFNIVLEARP